MEAYRIADNQTATLSQFDDNLLSLELLGLQEMGFDLNLSGFSGNELLRLLESESTEGQTDPDDIPEPLRPMATLHLTFPSVLLGNPAFSFERERERTSVLTRSIALLYSYSIVHSISQAG